MGTSNAYKVTMFFPLRNNDGEEYGLDVWAWWHERITAILAGFTDLGQVKGWWLGYSDENRWIVAVVKSEEEVKLLREFLGVAATKKYFDQEKMFLEYHSTCYEEISRS
jgi:hypothetical protein